MLLPTINNPMAPTKPIIIPTAFIQRVLILNNKTPNNNVNKGVSEFNIPAKELLIPVSAFVNKKAGMKFPSTPIPTNPFQCFNIGILTCRNTKGDKNKKAIRIRSAATSSLENTSIPRFIKIKELPQIRARMIRMIH